MLAIFIVCRWDSLRKSIGLISFELNEFLVEKVLPI